MKINNYLRFKMAVKICNSQLCCRDTNYKICKDISCGDGEESHQCRIPDNCKAVDCFCILRQRNCIGNEDGSLGIETDEGKNYIFVENGCHGLFRVCYKKETQCQRNSTLSTRKPAILEFTTPTHVTKKRQTVSPLATTIPPRSTSYLPNIAKEDQQRNTGLLLGLPLALVAVVMVIIIIVYIQYKRRKSSKTNQNDETKGKRDLTYTSNIAVDDEVVYDVIRDNHINTSFNTSSPVYNSGFSNITDQDETRLPAQANGDYFVSSNDAIIGANGAMPYYIKPSGTHYFVLEKDEGVYEHLCDTQNDMAKNDHNLWTTQGKVEIEQQEANNLNEYFVLEKERTTT